jgi:uncharacterized protein YigE (DUF2233 family)
MPIAGSLTIPQGKTRTKTTRILPLALFVGASAAQAQQAALRFDIVSVKLSDPAKEHLALYWRQPDGLKWDGVTLRGMIANDWPADIRSTPWYLVPDAISSN